MSSVQIPNLGGVAAVSGTDLVEAVQAGVSVKESMAQIAAYVITTYPYPLPSIVNTFSAGSTGLTPVAPTTGDIVLSGTLNAAHGGTGFSTYTVGDLVYADTTTSLAKLADIATGNALLSGGIGVAPSWGKIDLTTTVTGVLPPANGGTGIANNAASTLTISGNFPIDLTVGASTSLTLPSAGTVATLAGTETFTNKTITTFGGAFTFNPANASATLSPTGTGTVTISPATTGTINNMTIGGTSPGPGNFTTLIATGQTSLGGTTNAESLRVTSSASLVNRFTIQGATTGNPPAFYVAGSDTNVSMVLGTQGSGQFAFQTNIAGSAAQQVSITHTASANRYLTFTGSNGGNPTIGTSAGSLAITPATVFASTISATTGTFSAGVTLSGTASPLILNAAAGTSGQLLTSAGPGATPAWITILPPANGGTGIANNAASTLTISGNFATTFTVSNTTSVTLPTSGTLATLAGAETLTNKTITTFGGAFTFNPSNANFTLSPTGTGTGAINPATTGTIDNMTIGGTTPRAVTGTTISDSVGNVRSIIHSGTDKVTNYSLLAADNGQYISLGASGAITIPNSTLADGNAVSVFNNTSSGATITVNTTTGYIAGIDSNKGGGGTVTLATRGTCTILFLSATSCVISGNVS